MSKVYVVQQPMRKNHKTGMFENVFDMEPAGEFGEIICLLPPNVKMKNVQGLAEELEEKLVDFEPDEDLLLPVGNPILILTCAIIIARNSGGLISVLSWNRHQRVYKKVKLNLSAFSSNN